MGIMVKSCEEERGGAGYVWKGDGVFFLKHVLDWKETSDRERKGHPLS